MRRLRGTEYAAQKRVNNEFDRGAKQRAGQDDRVNPDRLLAIARDDVRVAILHDVAHTANSLVARNRDFARKVVGIGSRVFDPETEAGVVVLKNALDGEASAVDATARDVLKNCLVDSDLKAASQQLEKIKIIHVILVHSMSLDTKREDAPNEREVFQSLMNLDQDMAKAVRKEIQNIADGSPYVNVRLLAKKVLETLD